MPPKDTSPPVGIVQVSQFYDGQTVHHCHPSSLFSLHAYESILPVGSTLELAAIPQVYMRSRS